MNIKVVPLTVRFSGISYLDGIDITNEQFYDMLEKSAELPTTSLVPPQTFVDVFKAYLDAGDEVVGIFISAEISGTYNSACIAKEALASDKLHIVDSRGTAMSLALLVSEAAKHRDAGFTAAQIVEHVKALTKKVRFWVVLNSLKYARKGGRISAATAVIGEVLGMKPIVSIIDGTIHAIGKARGTTAALKIVLQDALTDLPDLRYNVVFAHSCAPELMNKAIEYFKEPLRLTSWLTCSAGSVIGTYAGKGVIGMSYIAE